MSIIRFDSPGPFPHLSIQTFNLPDGHLSKKHSDSPTAKVCYHLILQFFFIRNKKRICSFNSYKTFEIKMLFKISLYRALLTGASSIIDTLSDTFLSVEHEDNINIDNSTIFFSIIFSLILQNSNIIRITLKPLHHICSKFYIPKN